MKKIDLKKLVHAIESQGIIAIVLDIGGRYSVRCEWSCDNTWHDIHGAKKRARRMLVEAVNAKRRQENAMSKIYHLSSGL